MWTNNQIYDSGTVWRSRGLACLVIVPTFAMQYVIYDPHRRGFWKSPTKVVPSPDKAKVWGQLSAAIAQASIANRSRNVPDHQVPSPHHCDLPDFVVRGYDDCWMCMETHSAPPHHFLS